MKRKRILTKQGLFIIVALLTFAVTACYIPFTDVLIKSVTDEIPPEILISEPADNSNYSSTVVVSGAVTDITATDGTAGEVRTLSWSVSPEFITGGDVEIDADGSFSFDFLTTDFTGSVVLSLEARDANGNAHGSSLTLNQASSDIPSFTAVAGNQEVVLSWDPVPMSETYTLFYTTDGSQPSEFYGTAIADVTSPYTLSSLGNGARHVFLLRSISGGSVEDFSDYVESIPLSPATLQPTLRETTGGVSVVWLEIAGTDRYTVLRATNPAGPFINISGSTNSTTFVDSSVAADIEYWYQVHPALSADVVSNTISIRTTPFINAFASTTLRMPGYTDGIAISGNYAYLALGSVGLRVVDISTPSAPAVVGSLDFTGNATDIAVSGSHAYMVDYSAGVRVIDISTPTAPALITTVGTTGSANAIKISGTYAYVATTAGLDVIDIATPASAALVPLSPFNAGGGEFSVEVSGATAYAGTATGVVVFNISDPPNTVATGDTINLSETVLDLGVAGDYAYIASTGGFTILDISTIAAPVTLLHVPYSPGFLQDVELIGEFVLLSGYNGLEIYNAQSPLSVNSAYLAKTIETPAIALRTATAGSYVGFGTSSDFSMIDFSILAATVTDAAIGGIGATEGLVDVRDGVAYLVDDAGLTAYDTAGATTFSLIGEVIADGLVYAMDVSGDVVYAGVDSSPNLRISAYAPGSGFTELTPVDTGEPYGGVVVHGDHVFVPVTGGVKIVDSTNPAGAAITSELTVASVDDFATSRNRSYSIVFGTGLMIHDITDPEHPEWMYTRALEDYGVAVGVSFAATWDFDSATLVNIDRLAEDITYTIPVAPLSHGISGTIYNIKFVGDLLFATTSAGIEIVDFSDLADIRVIRTVADAGAVFRVFPQGRYFYARSAAGPRVLTWNAP